MHGTQYANYAVSQADLIVAVGVRFDDRVTGKLGRVRASGHLHPRGRRPGRDHPRTWPSTCPSWATPSGCSRRLLAELKKLELSPGPSPALDGAGRGLEEGSSAGGALGPEDGEIMPEWAIKQDLGGHPGRGGGLHRGGPAPDVGGPALPLPTSAPFHQLRRAWAPWASASRRPSGRRWPGPGQLVIDIAGDGSFQMTLQELATAVQYELPVKVCIINNQYLGMVRQWQELFWNSATTAIPAWTCQPDFVKLAEAYGAEGYRASRPEDLEEVLRVAFATDAPGGHRHPRQAGGQRLSHDPRGRHRPRHDGGGADEAHTIRAGGEQAGRADPRGRPLRPARVQHRQPGGGGDREPGRLAHDHHRRTSRTSPSSR